MKALISINEKIYDNGNIIGCRIVEVSENIFEVHENLFWVDCNDNINTNNWCYSGDKFIKIPIPEVPPEPTIENLQNQLKFLTDKITAMSNTGG